MPNKLTDAEVKKALECYIKSSHLGECFENECPLVSEEGCKVGKETLYPYVLDLINRKEKKMTELQELVDEMSDFFPACIDCEGKTKEGVRTDKCVYMIDNTNYCTKRGIKNISAIRNENRELKAEVEQLEKDKEKLAYSFANAVGQKMTAKAEAYKECLEKIEQRDVSESDFYIMIKKTEFDNLLKEFERKESTIYDD